MNIYSELARIQKELRVPKNQYNNFGKYKYRSCEDILEGLKPVQENCSVTLSDSIEVVGDRIYVKATATLCHPEAESVASVTAYAREPVNKKGADESQITGAASSYARKYALSGLFAIDDTKDADHGESVSSSGDYSASKTISEAQLKRLYAIASSVGLPQAKAKAIIQKYGFESSKNITPDKYDIICREIEGLKNA